MEITGKLEGNIAYMGFGFDKKELELLGKIYEDGYLEFRRGREVSAEVTTTIDNLFEHGLIDFNEDSWHEEYIPTKLGHKIIRCLFEGDK